MQESNFAQTQKKKIFYLYFMIMFQYVVIQFILITCWGVYFTFEVKTNELKRLSTRIVRVRTGTGAEGTGAESLEPRGWAGGMGSGDGNSQETV